MTFAAANSAHTSHAFSKRLFVLLAAATLIGSAFFPRGPDYIAGPTMAEHPVVQPDGTPLFVQKYEVTVAEWNVCYAAGACTLGLRVTGNHTPEEMPATGLSYVDVTEFLGWINGATGHDYRLPSLQEWEYMAAEVLPPTPDPIFSNPELTWASAYLMEPQTKRTLRPQGAFATTTQGIVDLNGSVWEWTQDCYAGVSEGQINMTRCPAFFVGGEHVSAMSYLVRNPARGGCAVGAPPAHLGMRLVSDQKPNDVASLIE